MRDRLTRWIVAEHDEEEDERDVVVALQRLELVAEEVERVDVRDPVRPVGDVVVLGQAEERDRLAVVGDGDEELAEEERHDRQVVADEPPRGQRDDEAEAGGRERDEHEDRERRPVLVELRRGEHRVAVGAEAEEGGVAEVEQARRSRRRC